MNTPVWKLTKDEFMSRFSAEITLDVISLVGSGCEDKDEWNRAFEMIYKQKIRGNEEYQIVSDFAPFETDYFAPFEKERLSRVSVWAFTVKDLVVSLEQATEDYSWWSIGLRYKRKIVPIAYSASSKPLPKGCPTDNNEFIAKAMELVPKGFIDGECDSENGFYETQSGVFAINAPVEKAKTYLIGCGLESKNVVVSS